ncbi:MAG: tetratricopeptide repeat protein [Candidatus Sericytochromatia bacterium]|nr:tetratricopeptide repeat protein [Candidatus Sericytochromatia bacterium]
MNMDQLAQAVGVSKSFISLLESGGRQPSREVVQKLAAALSHDEPAALRDELLILAGFAPVNIRAVSAYQDALQTYTQSLLQDPDNFRLYTRVVMALIKAERYEQARERIQEGLQRFQHSVQLQFLLAQLELSKGNYAAAILNQETAIRQFEHQSDTLTLQRADLVFNLGAIYFMQGYHFLGQAARSPEVESAKSQGLKAFETARGYFEEALKASPDDVYMMDEYARLLFNRAYLLQQPVAWELTIQMYRKVLTCSNKHELGPQPLRESAAFLAHAYTQSGALDEAELTLGLMTSFYPDYWLLHYLNACLQVRCFERSGETRLLDQALQALDQALQHDTQGQARSEAEHDPDLAVLRQQRQSAFAKVLKKVRPQS